MIYLSVFNPPNTTLLAQPCFFAIMELSDGAICSRRSAARRQFADASIQYCLQSLAKFQTSLTSRSFGCHGRLRQDPVILGKERNLLSDHEIAQDGHHGQRPQHRRKACDASVAVQLADVQALERASVDEAVEQFDRLVRRRRIRNSWCEATSSEVAKVKLLR
jgi:hypothetical protein